MAEKSTTKRTSTNLTSLCRFFSMLFLLLCTQQTATAQEASDSSSVPKLKISGSLGLNQDFFGYSTNDLLYRPYRPTSVTRLNVGVAFSYRNFSLPFALSLSTQKGGNAFNSPIPQKFSFRDLLNSYNQLSFSPKFGSLQLLLGTQVPKYSELTTGDLPIFGVGAEWSPRKFRLAAFWGMSQRGVSWDTLSQQLGAFRRISMTGKLGFGNQEATHFYLIAAHHRDNTASAIVNPESGIRPQENVVGSVDFKLLLFKKFFIQGEGAVSAFSRDLLAAPFESDSFRLNAPRFLVEKVFVPRLSSSFGAAGNAAVGFNGQAWGFRAVARVFSPQYQTLNYPFLQSDRLEWLIEPRLNLFEGKFTFNGSIGQRQDNLFLNKIATAYQTLGSANVTIQITPKWSISGNFANFGMRNTLANDTFRLQNVSRNLSITSNYTFNIGKVASTVTATYTQDNFDDFNVVSGLLANFQSRIYLLTYSVAFENTPLTLSTIGTSFTSRIAAGDVGVNMATLVAAYPFGKNKDINISLQGNIMRTTLMDFSPDDNITASLNISYNLLKKIQLNANGTLNIYRYGTAKPGLHYRENALRLGANYSF